MKVYEVGDLRGSDGVALVGVLLEGTVPEVQRAGALLGKRVRIESWGGQGARTREDLEDALSRLALERDELARENDRLRAELELAAESASMSCVTPADDCRCSGCRYADERRGA